MDFGSIFSSIGNAIKSPIGQSLLNTGIGLIGSKYASDRTQGAVNQAATQGRVDPYNIFSPFGNVISENGAFQFQAPSDPYGVLPEELLQESAGYADLLGSQRDVYGTLGAGYLGELERMGFDPRASADNRYEMLSAAAQPRSNRMFQALEQRLHGQGRLGTTGGGEAFRGFFESENQADLERRLAAEDFAQRTQSHLADLGGRFSGGATSAGAARFGLASDLLGTSQGMFAPLQNAAQLGIMAGAPNTAAGSLVDFASDAKAPGSPANYANTVTSIAGQALPGIFNAIGGYLGGGKMSAPGAVAGPIPPWVKQTPNAPIMAGMRY